MKKHTVLFMVLCQTLVVAAICFAVINCLCSCSLESFSDKLEYEDVRFELPVWPAELPPLVQWNVELYVPQEETCIKKAFAPETQSFQFRLKKNAPLYVCAQPVTGTKQEAQIYFKCAGSVYPWECSATGDITKSYPFVKLTWSGGYAANLMRTLVKTSLSAGYNTDYVCSYIALFNWGRLVQTLEQKEEESLQTSVFYNPWLLDTQTVLEGIAYDSFSATKLKATSVFAVSLDFPVFSSYVPENMLCGPAAVTSENPEICVSLRKNEASLFALPSYTNSDCNVLNSAIIIYGSSQKKISLEFISMPIYIEEI